MTKNESALIKWLESLPTKPRHENGGYHVSLAHRMLREFLEFGETGHVDVMIRWLTKNNRAVPYGVGEITYLIQD